jgi:hypothetical protein
VDNAAVVPDSGWKRFWLGSLNLVLALLAALLVCLALFAAFSSPQVDPSEHPGVRTYVEVPGEPPIISCGGSSLQVAVLGAKVVATTPEHARTARTACWRAAWIPVGSGVVALLLGFLSLFGAAKLKARIERGGRLAPSQPNGQEPALGGGSAATQHSAQPAVARQPSAGLGEWNLGRITLFFLVVILLAIGGAYFFRPVPATTKFGGRWRVYTSSDFQISLPTRYVGGVRPSGAENAIAAAAYGNPFYSDIAQPELADLPAEVVFWAIAPIDCCQSWSEVGKSFLVHDDSNPNAGHSGITEVMILKTSMEEDVGLADYRDVVADPAFKVRDERMVSVAGQQAIRLVEDEGRDRYLTYLLKDRGVFWEIYFSADRDKFSAFVPLFEQSARSFRLPAT